MGLSVQLTADGGGKGLTRIVVGNAHKLSRSALARPELMDAFGRASNVIVSGESEHVVVDVAREAVLKTIVSGKRSSSGCGFFRLPSLYPMFLFSNLVSSRSGVVSPCDGDLGASSFSGQAMATATIADLGL
jgi:hypothetical protein